MMDSCKDVTENADIVIVGLNDKQIVEDLHQYTSKHQIVLDLVNVPDKEKLNADYHGVCW